ncbi:MAG: HEAT repeat domain-containing protein [Planctomycetes bacterium]|nr:HEAT repeat domain-containing protein [Planctomycetota bacterium]
MKRLLIVAACGLGAVGGCGGTVDPIGREEAVGSDAERRERYEIYRAIRLLQAGASRSAAVDRLASAPPWATPIVCQSLQNARRASERKPLLDVLALRRDPASIPVLVRMLGAGDPVVLATLETITGQSLGADPVAWFDWWIYAYPLPEAERAGIARAFAKGSVQDRAQALTDLVSFFPRTRIRSETQSAGGRISYAAEVDDPEATDRKRAALVLLESAFADPNPYVRQCAQNLAVNLGRTAIPLLRGELAAPDAVRRSAASATLGEIGLAPGIPALMEALGDPHPLVAAEAAFALAKVGDPAAQGGLRRAALALDERRAPALAALASLGEGGGLDPLLLLLRVPGTRAQALAALERLAGIRYESRPRPEGRDLWLARHRLRVGAGALRDDPEAWRRWWEAERPPTRPRAENAR